MEIQGALLVEDDGENEGRPQMASRPWATATVMAGLLLAIFAVTAAPAAASMGRAPAEKTVRGVPARILERAPTGVEDEPTKCLGIPADHQLLRGEVLPVICHHLGKNKTFLIFGTGLDSSFWSDSNAFGTTHWLEDRTGELKYLPDEVQAATTVVTYTTTLDKALGQVDNETILREFYDHQLPEEVKTTKWGTILVEGPQGWGDGPGRGQSIYAAALLAAEGAYVYINDCQRPVENAYIERWFVQKGWNKYVHNDNGDGQGGKLCTMHK